ncbi:MAG: SAM-dependent methyltransferase [Pseudomonadota bacterium]
MSRNRWLQRQANDPFVKQARADGYRARAAYKLKELNDKDRLFKRGQRVVDLGAAPGSWSQVAVELTGGPKCCSTVVALDLLPMDPLDGVVFIQGDFRDDEPLQQLETTVGSKVDLVLSDMAPNISGIAPADQARSMHLAELALDFAIQWLHPNGALVIKLFQGQGFDAFVQQARSAFREVRLRKPDASRSESREVYLVAKSLR